MTPIDLLQAALTLVGLGASLVLATMSVRDWRRTHRRWAYRAALMSICVVVVWVGFLATLSTRIWREVPLELAQMLALGSRTTLLAMVVWLIWIHGREPSA